MPNRNLGKMKDFREVWKNIDENLYPQFLQLAEQEMLSWNADQPDSFRYEKIDERERERESLKGLSLFITYSTKSGTK